MKTLKMMSVVMAVTMLISAQLNAQEFDLARASTHDRMTYHRSIDAAVWAMPLMCFKFWRDSLVENGVGPNDVGYNSKVQDWRFQTATPNNTTPYIHTYWNIADGPVVFEMPASVEGIGIFGTIMIAVFGQASFAAQLGSLAIVGVFTLVVTFVLVKVVSMITPLRVDEETETTGLDLTVHGERAYDVSS